MKFHSIVCISLLFAGMHVSPECTAGVSVRAGNDTGLSDSIAASDPYVGPLPPEPNPVAWLPYTDIFQKLKTPALNTVRRLDLSSVRIEWDCEPPNLDLIDMVAVEVRILRQAKWGEWQIVHTQFWNPSGIWVDTDAPISETWRYSAALVYVDPHNPAWSAGSNATSPRNVEYTPSIFGARGYRHGSPTTPYAPPGKNLTGPGFADSFRIAAKGSDENGPAFIATTGSPPPIEAPIVFTLEGYRYFPNPEPAYNYTELSAQGYVVRGITFAYEVSALVTREYESAHAQLSPAYISQPSEREPNKANFRSLWNVSADAEVFTCWFEGRPEDGFDDVSDFALQHVPNPMVGVDGKRILTLKKRGSGPGANLQESGPFSVTNWASQPDGQTAELRSTSASTIPNTTGQVLDSTTQRKLKVVTLPRKDFTVGIYPVTIHDAWNSETHSPPPMPDVLAIKNALNEVYGRQANIHFDVVEKPGFMLNTDAFGFPPPLYPMSTNKMKAALWANSHQDTDFVLFWLADLELPQAKGEAFEILSRGAVIGSLMDMRTIPHEIGHCLGLEHCWVPTSIAGFGSIADVEMPRLMGYAGGTILRRAEIAEIIKWEQRRVNPLGGPAAP